MKNALECIKETGIVAIVRKVSKDEILPIVQALKDGGIKCIEVTFNTPGAQEMIKMIKENFNDEVFVGAGTVLNEEMAKKAYDAGAQFVLSPNVDRSVIEFCKEKNMYVIPGAYTPTEMVMAQTLGADMIKAFPAGAVGPDYIKMVRGPLDDTCLMAVGGINLENTQTFIESGCVCVGVGGSLIRKDYIAKKEYDKLCDLAKSFVEKIKKAKKSI